MGKKQQIRCSADESGEIYQGESTYASASIGANLALSLLREVVVKLLPDFTSIGEMLCRFMMTGLGISYLFGVLHLSSKQIFLGNSASIAAFHYIFFSS